MRPEELSDFTADGLEGYAARAGPNLLRGRARAVREIDMKRIGVDMIVEFRNGLIDLRTELSDGVLCDVSVQRGSGPATRFDVRIQPARPAVAQLIYQIGSYPTTETELT